MKEPRVTNVVKQHLSRMEAMGTLSCLLLHKPWTRKIQSTTSRKFSLRIILILSPYLRLDIFKRCLHFGLQTNLNTFLTANELRPTSSQHPLHYIVYHLEPVQSTEYPCRLYFNVQRRDCTLQNGRIHVRYLSGTNFFLCPSLQAGCETRGPIWQMMQGTHSLRVKQPLVASVKKRLKSYEIATCEFMAWRWLRTGTNLPEACIKRNLKY